MVNGLCYGFSACLMYFFHRYGISMEGIVILLSIQLFDVVFGILRSRRMSDGRGDWFSSRRLWIGLISKVGVNIAIILLGALLHYATASNAGLNVISDYGIAVLIAYFAGGEFISMIRSLVIIKTGQSMVEWDAVAHIYKFILARMKNSIESFTSSDRNDQ